MAMGAWQCFSQPSIAQWGASQRLPCHTAGQQVCVSKAVRSAVSSYVVKRATCRVQASWPTAACTHGPTRPMDANCRRYAELHCADVDASVPSTTAGIIYPLPVIYPCSMLHTQMMRWACRPSCVRCNTIQPKIPQKNQSSRSIFDSQSPDQSRPHVLVRLLDHLEQAVGVERHLGLRRVPEEAPEEQVEQLVDLRGGAGRGGAGGKGGGGREGRSERCLWEWRPGAGRGGGGAGSEAKPAAAACLRPPVRRCTTIPT